MTEMPRVLQAANLFGHEFKRTVRQFFRYPVAVVILVVVMLLIFLGIVQTAVGVSSGSSDGPIAFAQVAQRYVIWSATIIGIASVSGAIEDDTRAGTMELAWLSPVPLWLILIARATASTVLVVLTNLILAGVIAVFVGASAVFSVSFVVAIGLAGAGGMSLGLVLGAFVIRYKSIGPAANIFQFLLLPTFLGAATAPGWLWFVPSGGALIYGTSPHDTGLMIMALAASAVWLAIGAVSVTIAQTRSRVLGIVNQY